MTIVSGLLLWTAAGCAPGGDSVDSEPEFVPTGELSLAQGTDVVTYFTATWTSDAPGPTRIEVLNAEGPVLVSDWVDGPSGVEVPILGMWVSDTFTVRLVDDAEHVLAETSVTTGAGPTELSNLNVNGTASWSGYVVTELGAAELQTVLILAPNGRPVWYWQNLGNQITRAAVRHDGRGLWLVGVPSPMGGGELGWIRSIAWDGSVLTEVVPTGHDGQGSSIDILEMEDGTLLFLGEDTREVDGTDFEGSTLFALDADGTERELWSFWEKFEPEPGLQDGKLWTHANALRWNEDRQTVWVGARGLSALVELDPTTWELKNQFGGSNPTFRVSADTVTMRGQHQFDFRGGRLAMHDNRDSTVGSRIVVYDLDFELDEPEADQSWEYVPDPTAFDFILGDVTWLDDESLFVTWSTTGLLEERTLAGEVPWSISLDFGMIFAYTVHIDALPGATPAR